MCPNMIHFDALDFSECRSEEVISFFFSSFDTQCSINDYKRGDGHLRFVDMIV